MGSCKKDVSPLLIHWSYFLLAPTHQFGQNLVKRIIYHYIQISLEPIGSIVENIQ